MCPDGSQSSVVMEAEEEEEEEEEEYIHIQIVIDLICQKIVNIV